MREGRALVGWGTATASYPAHRSQAKASASIRADGTALGRSGTQGLGTGTYTVMTQIVADALGMPVANVLFGLGDAEQPEAPVSGGSQTVAGVGPTVHAAAQAARDKVVVMAVGDASSPVHGLDAAEVMADNVAPDLGTIRIPRVVGAYGIGKLMDKTGHSQLMDGIAWGPGMGLVEKTEIDWRSGRPLNASVADDHIPVNAAIGEIGIVGVAAALANAVYHATGKPIRDLPITLDKLL
jgi:xanthine dehydrogenase YagR molybdenum-binding subunit